MLRTNRRYPAHPLTDSSCHPNVLSRYWNPRRIRLATSTWYISTPQGGDAGGAEALQPRPFRNITTNILIASGYSCGSGNVSFVANQLYNRAVAPRDDQEIVAAFHGICFYRWPQKHLAPQDWGWREQQSTNHLCMIKSCIKRRATMSLFLSLSLYYSS